MTCRMKFVFLHSIIIITLICIHINEAKKSIVYYVRPTKSLSSCPGNSSCQLDQQCYTLDYFARNSEQLFSQNDNITLIFMCGIHNHTKSLTVQSINTFIMKGDGKSNENVIINQTFNAQHGKHNRIVIRFFNVSYVNISTLTMRHPSIIVNHSLLTIKRCKFYGYTDTKESMSYINITGRYSQALLDDCTFKENCFIISDATDGITVSNSIFQAYNHHSNSIMTVFSSVVKITGNVNFTNSIKAINPYEYSTSYCGTAILLRTINPQFKSSLNIASGATVNFVNLTCRGNGGALYSENGLISIGAKAQVIFMNNVANTGGAILLKNGEFKVQFNTNLNFSNNFAYAGGAIGLINSTVHIIHTDTINFDNNMGAVGGAMYIEFGTMNISSNSSVTFKTNNAYVEGGAIHIERGVPSSIIVDDFAELLFLNNSAFRGGALYMKPSSFAIKIGYHSSLKFVSNTALYIGGAMYSEMQSAIPCAFMITDYSAEINFRGNHANGNVGHHMYGSSIRSQKCDKDHLKFYYKQAKPYCWKQSESADGYVNISFDPGQLSSVSSAPRRACLCDINGKPQCANFSLIFTNIKAYRGEIFTLPACVVGYNFGTTVGTVYARFLHSNLFTQAHLQKSQYNQLINDHEACTKLKYSVSTTSDTEILLLQTSVLPVPVYINETESNVTNLSREKERIHRFIANYVSHQHDGCISESLLRTPIIINITLLPGCPQGIILNHNHAKCRCYPVLAVNGFRCSIQNKIGYLEWNNTGWVNATINDRLGNSIIYNSFCPLNYCKSGKKMINIRDNPWRQCASNRTGVLCGACIENFSLAIGSPRCIECHNRRNMTLLLVFAIAGVFLVFFILIIDFTVTQGHVNGLIFYANIVWTYKTILFPITRFNHDNNWVTVLNIFIAWLNLDFGIESCFIVGLNAYWKTWMQFIFPFYIWTIAGVITVICHYSSRLTNLIGSRAVPLLATLFLLSYMKLLRTVVDATSIAMIEQYPENTSYAVWYLDGNLRYCHGPHTYLFVAAVFTFVILWLPYTFLLLFIQPLRKLSHLGPLRWVHKFTPIYDAYLSPLNNEHQYWFGITLLVRGVLLVVLTMISSTSPKMNLFVILAAMTVLVVGLSIKNVYKQMTMRALESTVLLNLIVWSAGTLYKWESIESKMIIESVSIGIVFAQFWLIVVCNLIKLGSRINQRCERKKSPYAYHIILDNEITHERIEDPDLPDNY